MKRPEVEKLVRAYGELEYLFGLTIGYSWCERKTKEQKRKMKAFVHGMGKLRIRIIDAMVGDELKIKDLKKQADFLFKFYQLGYDHAINTLQRAKCFYHNKEWNMKEYFMEQVIKEGLIKKDG
jgi:hypothetical protein